MGFRFRKRIKIAPGFNINVSKSGASFSVGKRGAMVNFGPLGQRLTGGIPGSGVSYSKRIGRRLAYRSKYAIGAFVVAALILWFVYRNFIAH
jgi:hypothetical protein